MPAHIPVLFLLLVYVLVISGGSALAVDYSILPHDAAPEEFEKIESALPMARNFTPSWYAWSVGAFTTRTSVLGIDGKRPVVELADYSVLITPAIMMPRDGELRMELHAHYFNDFLKADAAFQESAKELHLLHIKDIGKNAVERGRLVSYVLPGSGDVREFSRLKYEIPPPAWPAGSFITSGSGSIIAFLPAEKGKTGWMIRLDFSAKNAPDSLDVVRTIFGVVLYCAFDRELEEYVDWTEPAARDETSGNASLEIFSAYKTLQD